MEKVLGGPRTDVYFRSEVEWTIQNVSPDSGLVVLQLQGRHEVRVAPQLRHELLVLNEDKIASVWRPNEGIFSYKNKLWEIVWHKK